MSKIVFLTSSPDTSYQKEDGTWVTGPFSSRNGFLEKMRAVWPWHPAKVLAISADPDNFGMNDEMQGYYTRMIAASGLPMGEIFLLDSRTENRLEEWMAVSDFIILSGGHVPTENTFFTRIGLREKILNWNGFIMGISAGSMNCADEVYAQPEMPGESVDPDYQRHIPGLGLTQINMIPHYQMVKDNMLDGRRLYEDITFEDSHGYLFYVLEDGSYILQEEDKATLYGNAYEIRDGVMRQICWEGESLVIG